MPFMGRRLPGPRSATFTSPSTAGPKRRRQINARPAILLDGRSKRRRTTLASSPTPPSCWLSWARISVPWQVDRALVLTPSFARGWYLSGLLRVFAGQHDLAIEHLETALRLSPRERMGQPLSAMGTAYFFKHRFDEAAANLLLALQDHPGFTNSYRTLAACYAHMGRLDEARSIVAKLRAITTLLVPEIL